MIVPRPISTLICVLCVALPTAVLAAPPPGHLTPQQTRELLMPDRPANAEDLPNIGTVLTAIDANQFTYIEVENGNRREWIAAPLMEIKPGAVIRYEAGSVMSNFYSKLLKRNFEKLMFVGEIAVVKR